MSENNDEKQVLSSRRRTALLRYIGIMFAAAFVLVTISLVLQMRNSRDTISELNQTNSSALSNAEQLQNQNQKLQEEKEALLRENAELSAELEHEKAFSDKLLSDTQSDTEQSEQQHRDEMEKLQTEYERTLAVYEALAFAAACEEPEGNVTYSRAMETLKQYSEYLSENGQIAYRKLLGK